MLWLFRTGKFVSDKLQCLLSIIPDLELTDDKGEILNVRNGLLNIYTKELRQHTPDFVSLVQFPVMYDTNALCPVWDKCMEDWMNGPEKEDKKLLLQQFAGYILSSEMLYDRALFLVGDGANGKSTFVDTLAMIVGRDGVSHIDLEGLYTQFGMKGLIGKRLNVIEEVHGNYYQSNKLKKLISGEPVTIDIKHKDQFAFRPQAKFVFAVNIMPRVDDTSTATERRICAVVFGNNFRNNPKIELRGKSGLLAQEVSGILNWMLEGAGKLKEAKTFVVTKEQIALLAEYRQENSSVEAFIADCLEFVEGQSMETIELYDEYKKYCQSDGRKFKARTSFTKELKAYGHRHDRFSFLERAYGKGPSVFEGIRINHEWSKESVANNEFKNNW
jgi:putative DNA primase/helicase